ncbi:Magnesium transporter MRS2-I [Dendrobium catenatum]|uniref:Magnesium transporter MRS2-I n=1 Tax=Dendrobium catenatum TaxID=906689 RepID=A0A2I0V7I9_9ASPA|nr:Magnesium transporter MRS2-I [Dendrobium catenatum]
MYATSTVLPYFLLSQVRDELEQLLDDDDDMADLYLSRKLAGASSPVSGSVATNWGPGSPTIGSKISRASRASAATIHGNENDVEELEMLLEVISKALILMTLFLRLRLSYRNIMVIQITH